MSAISNKTSQMIESAAKHYGVELEQFVARKAILLRSKIPEHGEIRFFFVGSDGNWQKIFVHDLMQLRRSDIVFIGCGLTGTTFGLYAAQLQDAYAAFAFKTDETNRFMVNYFEDCPNHIRFGSTVTLDLTRYLDKMPVPIDIENLKTI
jgi:hypothetical protein